MLESVLSASKTIATCNDDASDFASTSMLEAVVA